MKNVTNYLKINFLLSKLELYEDFQCQWCFRVTANPNQAARAFQVLHLEKLSSREGRARVQERATHEKT